MSVSRTLLRAALFFQPLIAAAQGRIIGTVYDSLSSHAPLRNATVVVVELERYATSDARGKFTIEGVPNGSYTLGLMHAVLDSFDIALPPTPVRVADGRTTSVTLSTPSLTTLRALICPTMHVAEPGVIMGRVRDVDDQGALADAEVAIEWTDLALVLPDMRVVGHPVRETARTNRGGVYVLCGLPQGVEAVAYVTADGFAAGPRPVELDERLVGRLDFAVSRRDSASRYTPLVDSSVAPSRFPGTASLRGSLHGKDGRPIRSATVLVAGTQRSAPVDSSGVYRLDGVPAGSRTVEIRAIGYLPMTFGVDFRTAAATDTTFVIDRAIQNLTPVTVKATADRMSPMVQSGFEQRRMNGLGTFVTGAEIARRASFDLRSVLESTLGIHIEYSGIPPVPTPYMHGNSWTGLCKPNYFLDGAPFTDGFTELSNTVAPEMIKGMEVYTTSGTIPMQYDLTSSTGCGSVVIWTR